MIRTLPQHSKRYALVIGVNDYSDSQLGDLVGANRDARALADALQQHAGFPPQQILLLTTDQRDKDLQPTRTNVYHQLSSLAHTVPEDGLLLVSFAGHGIEREEKPFLLTADARYNQSVSLLEDTAVSVARLKQYIKQTSVGQVIILLDACRNLPAGRALAPNPLTDAIRRGFEFDVRNQEVRAFATLYATAVGQFALEDTANKRGYFTTAVVEAMAGAAANERGEVTLNALVAYVQKHVPERVKQLGGWEQKPFAVIEGFKADELIIAVGQPRVQPPAPQVSIVTPAPQIDREGLFWDSIKYSDDAEDYDEYLTRWPQGDFVVLARRRLKKLAGSRDPFPVPQAPPAIVTSSKTEQRTGPDGVPLSKFTFETVTTNGFGKVVKRFQAEARQYVEELGDGVTLEMVEVPGGEFLMGTADAEVEKLIAEFTRNGLSKKDAEAWAKWQTPQRRVTVPTFFLGKFTVTQAQWKAVTGSLPEIDEKLRGDLLPVVNVSWQEAQEFCQAIGDGYRLPSEAEWEYACRAGKTTPFAFGPTVTPEVVNYDGNYPCGQAAKGEYRATLVPVGSLPANAWGLFEMHGNVWEWCEDDWHDSYKDAPTDGSAWKPADISARGSARVIRGGGWGSGAVGCRSAVRYHNSPGGRGGDLGFRLARTYR